MAFYTPVFTDIYEIVIKIDILDLLCYATKIE